METDKMPSGPWIPGEQVGGERLVAPAVQRNREAIAAQLTGRLPDQGTVLEIASGSGEHAVYFAGLFPHLVWQPSDADPSALASIEAWRQHSALENLRAPIKIDVVASHWATVQPSAILCINMLHISPWSAALGLISGARRLLEDGKPLLIYGPFIEDGVQTAPSNTAFDSSLKSRNPNWGLRAVKDVVSVARNSGYSDHEVVRMPTNNLLLVLRTWFVI